MNLLALVFLLFVSYRLTLGQSTCPVVQKPLDPQRCKCGIKIDGHIYIYCARKQLVSLPKFTRSSILYDELILSGNQITTIQKNSFTGLKVKRLLLDDNPIEYIEQNSFIELANYLEELILSVNSDTIVNRPKISLNLFQNLLNLKIIKLNGFDLGDFNYLKSNIFNRTRKLEVINLIDSGLSKIEAFSLNGVETSLRELNLDNNLLSSSSEIFTELKRMKRLSILNLSRNRIRQIPRYLDDSQIMLNDLQIDLSYNGIVSIDEYAFGVSTFDSSSTGLVNSLIKLTLNNNELSQFQLNFLSQLTTLKELYLDFNKIDYLPDNLFSSLRKLEVLSLKGNNIKYLKSEFIFTGLDFSLKKLNLASNKIEHIEKRVFFQVNKLRELSLDRNLLGVHFEKNGVYNIFEGLESELKVLNVEHNNLKPEHLEFLNGLLNLESLKLGNNNFERLDLKSSLDDKSEWIKIQKIFEFYRNLTQLDLQNTSLKQLPYFFGLNRSLINLNLAQNKICNINGLNLRKFYSKLKNLNIQFNPLKCCEIKALKEWSQNLENFNSSDFKCLNEFNERINLSDLELNNLKCDFNDVTCPLDHDEYYLKEIYSKITETTTTSSTSPSSTTTTTDKILIIESSPTKVPTIPYTKPLILLNTADQILHRQQIVNSVYKSESFFSSIELKQTLLGSFIGALSVIIIVLVLVCVLKTARNGKDLSLCGSEKDKSNTTSSTSPYELGKLSLQTLCLNSNCSTSSSSTNSSTNSCVCNLINGNEMFSKIDPMRLTMMNRASVQHPGYLTNLSNLHYLASNLPYTPGQSTSTSPTPYQINDCDTNQYDKLQRLANTNSFSSLKPSYPNSILTSQFSHNYNPNNLLTSTLSFQPNKQRFMTPETTPFLIQVNLPELVKQQQQDNLNSTNLNNKNMNNSTSQHTYHEIGEILINNLNTFNRMPVTQQQQQQNIGQQQDNQNQVKNELYI
ncbi:unnamed protein product [Brachionus calyciflorus]|uniref:Uncharacterized protein n=1 Tax=Brachionus calyciflorus TaxID=104777 RepID=A0A813NYU8_9BILA|nr:unnamed protein product [Brachionus calyciflorus]